MKEAIDVYMRKKGIKGDKKEKIKEGISNYLDRCYKEELDVKIDSISAIIDIENPNDFKVSIAENDIEVSDNIRIYKKGDYDPFVRNTIKEVGYKLTFEKVLIRDKKITRQDNNIIIHNVPVEYLELAFENEKDEDKKP